MILQFLTKSVGNVVPLVRFVGMGIIALALTLVSLTPMAAVAARAKMASLVASLVASPVQHMPCLAPM